MVCRVDFEAMKKFVHVRLLCLLMWIFDVNARTHTHTHTHTHTNCAYTGESIVVEVDRFDPGRLFKGNENIVPTALIPGDIAIPCQVCP